MNLGTFDKMTDYLFNNDVAQVELVITKIGDNDHQFTIKTIKPEGERYITKDSMGYSMQECQDDYQSRM